MINEIFEHSDSVIGAGAPGKILSHEEIQNIVSRALPQDELRGQRVLLIVPDGTRTAPVGTLFKTIFDLLGNVTKKLDVMIALGTHQPMSEDAINTRMEITREERAGKYSRVEMINHAWDDPNALVSVGEISAEEIEEISGGLFKQSVEANINRRVYDYDLLIIIGPVFPHEVVGFSGGNKYLFPGIAGGDVLNFFHWLGAVITNPKTIGVKWTPVRKVVDRAGALVKIPKLAFCMAVSGKDLAGLYAGTPEAAWSAAADLSDKIHIVYKDKPFHTVLSRAPEMYEDVWTGGKCMYKLEPVVADGGELIIYAPHIKEVSVTHGKLIENIGYHTRDYYLKQWDKFKDVPWLALAHSTHVRGVGAFEDGVEKPRVKVTLATQIPSEVCAKINMGYRDPNSINIADYENREDEGILYVPKAGEMLYRLKNPPEWARSS
jgi:nickel-dependent lactate racemase